MKEKLILPLIVFLFLILLTDHAYAESFFDATTETTCNNGVCTKKLFSGYSDSFREQLLTSDDFMEFFHIKYLEIDEDFGIEVLSFNNESIRFRLNVSEEYRHSTIPLEWKFKDDEYPQSMNYRLNSLTRIYNLGINLLDLEYVKWGFASTTITLQEADTENLNDNYALYSAGSGNGAYSYFYMGQYNNYPIYMYNMFSITSLPPGVDVVDATYCIYHYDDYLSSTHVGDTYNVFNITGDWDEGTCYDHTDPGKNCPDPDVFQDSDSPDEAPDSDFWQCFNVSGAVASSYNEGSQNVSFFINRSAQSNEMCYFYTKEYTGDSSKRPYLNISYFLDTDSDGIGDVEDFCFDTPGSCGSVNGYGCCDDGSVGDTISLRQPDNMITEDTYYDQDGTSTGGTGIMILDLFDGGGESPTIKFSYWDALENITIDSIENSTFCVNSETNRDGEIIEVHGFNESNYTDTWVEETLDEEMASVSPFYANMSATLNSSTWSDAGYYCYDNDEINDYVINRINHGTGNISFALNHTGNTVYYFYVSTKEDSVNYNYPILNFSYTPTEAGGEEYSRSVSDTMTLTDSASRVLDAMRSSSLTMTFNESAESNKTEGAPSIFNRSVSESFTLSESSSRKIDMTRSSSDSMTFADNISATNISADTTPPTVYIIKAGNGHTTPTSSYTHLSRQLEDYMFINISSNENMSACLLEWNNGTLANHSMTINNNDASTTCYINMTNQASGIDYTFKVYGNDTSNNWNNVSWLKFSPLGTYPLNETKYVRLNNTQTNHSYLGMNYSGLNYTNYYFYNATYSDYDENRPFILNHEQGINAGQIDTGYLRTEREIDDYELRNCGRWVGFWFDENITIEDANISNIYYHVWYNYTKDGGTENITVGYNKELVLTDTVLDGETINVETDNVLTLMVGGRNYSLITGLLDLSSQSTFNDNDIYMFDFKLTDPDSSYPNPYVINGMNASSFIILNLPANTTLDESDSDGDGWNDWLELFIMNTDPFFNDTDNDGIIDTSDDYPNDPTQYGVANEYERTATLSISMSETPSRLFEGNRESSLSLTFTDLSYADLVSILTRIADLDITFSDDSIRVLDAIRTSDLTMTFSDDVIGNLEGVITRLLQLVMTLTDSPSRILDASRMSELSMNFSDLTFADYIEITVFSRLNTLLMMFSEDLPVHIRSWEEVRAYDVCLILEQIGESRAYLCIYETGEYRIFIKGL